VACPFFMPVEKLENGSWMHAHRLPLGCGWSGRCTAPGHEDKVPSQKELQEYCNLGYAEGCGRLPRERAWDSVRFGARGVSGDVFIDDKNLNGGHIQIRYVCERDHRPVEHGTLRFDAITTLWERKHSDLRVQRMAECFLASYLEKRQKREADAALAS
jgi:hypothetical protein